MKEPTCASKTRHSPGANGASPARSKCMNLSSRTVLISTLFLVSCAAAQSPRSAYDPAPGKPQKHYDSFVDFALKQINPQDIDYGQRIEEARQNIIKGTIMNLEFWSNTLPLIVL